MKQLSLIFGISGIILILFGLGWSSLDMYDTPQADKWIIPYWGLFVATIGVLIYIVKKYDK